MNISFCDADYSYLNQEKKAHNFQWQSFNGSYSPDKSDQNIFSAFQYTKSSQIDSLPYTGILNTYMGGGYIFKMNNLANNQSELKTNLLGLKKHGWIDRRTRAIFIEFITYNPNINLFSKCLFLFEFISTGQIVSSSQFAPVNLFDINNISLISFNVIMFLIYMLFVTMCMLKETKELIKLRVKYFKQF